MTTTIAQRYEAGERDFSGADLRKAALNGADLTEANLSGARLEDETTTDRNAARAEADALRERVLEAEAEAIRWGDAVIAIGEAIGLPGAGSAEIVAAVRKLVDGRPPRAARYPI